jgi:hypothetical protein
MFKEGIHKMLIIVKLFPGIIYPRSIFLKCPFLRVQMKSKNANITFFFKRTFSKRTRNDQKCPNYRVQILYKKRKKRTFYRFWGNDGFLIFLKCPF